jgi:carbon monoxide dehydrogenase subunit G
VTFGKVAQNRRNVAELLKFARNRGSTTKLRDAYRHLPPEFVAIFSRTFTVAIANISAKNPHMWLDPLHWSVVIWTCEQLCPNLSHYEKDIAFMDLQGFRLIAADRATVWAALNDPEALMAAIPGCSALSGNSEDGFEATVTLKIGPVKATFKGSVTLSNVVVGESYRIAGEGKGGAAGFAKGGADVQLSDEDGGTRLSYDVQASVGGKLAQLGSRLIDGVARKLADQFFENFGNIVAPEAMTADEAAPESDERKPGWIAKLRG